MRIKAQNIRALMTLEGKTEYIISTSEKPTEELNDLIGKELSVEIKPYKARRSLDANAYCWVLCEKLAEDRRNQRGQGSHQKPDNLTT